MMLDAFTNHALALFLAAHSWWQWVFNCGRKAVNRLYSSFLFVVGCIHSACGRLIGQGVTWNTRFSFSSDETDEITMVVRMTSTMGYFDKRVQGSLTLQQFGSTTLFRLLLDGHEVLHAEDGETPLPGERFNGAVYLPENVQWEPFFRKVKSANTTSIRGRCTILKFGPNRSGISYIQATLIHTSSSKSADAKRASAAFEQSIVKAAEVVNSVSQSKNNFHL